MFAAVDIATFCNDTKELLQFVGYLLLFFKIAIPLIIIIFGALDFGKAVVASKDEEIKVSAKRLLWRAIAGVVIFFIPNIVIWVFSTIDDYTDGKGGFEKCEDCILSPASKC